MSTVKAKPGQATWWPAKVPTFTPIAPAPVLRMAIGWAAASVTQGQLVQGGETICPAAAGRPAVLAPCRARVGNMTMVEGIGRVRKAMELIPISDADAEASTATLPGATAGTSPPATSSTTPNPTPQALSSAPKAESFRRSSSADIGQWIDRLRDAGVSAQRTSSPDLIGQLNMALRRPVDTIICSVLDSDPTMRIQGAMCATYPEDLEAGMTLLLQCCQASRGFVVVEAWSPATWSVPVRKVLRGTPIKLVELANDYPQADPSLMLYTIARRRLRPGRLPVERATLLLDAAAVIAVGRTARGKPALPVHMGLRDRASGISYYIAAIDGTPLNHILADLPLTRPYILRGGDLLRDCRLGDDTTICAADERIIHVCPAEAVVNPEPCIRCAWCVESCPTRVHPALLLEAAQEHNLARARWAGLDACIECGICVHVCPSQLPILDGIRQLKLIVEDQDARPEAQRRGKSDVVAEDAPGDL